ncbi:CRISPR-associated helicase/endonuclease Cas3 [Sphingomonas rubra]|uniref:CRISPR-associated endonuclease/helicase Cas3 n=1 Tax=Sphingomonas rubra TaxID=634430 RepID=A0A1I5RPW1_9SPHN|nr:CRISPR-associated helicase/endonuclease Cas3 [Sphingomonas rubra]SFP60440.1 CRISPR-associated endonuclease/helicase Cas3 [Sphingomonas rubra]
MTETVQTPWAKLDRDEDDRVTAALPLVDHCLDVGTVFEIVLAAWRRPLEVAAGRPLTPLDIARLTVLVALHDLGKANRGFQARIDPKQPRIGHTGQVVALLEGPIRRTPAGRMLNGLIDDWGAYPHFAAVMAHHGRPLEEFSEDAMAPEDPWRRHVDHWKAGADGDPTAHVLTLIDAVRARWPLAWEEGPPLPEAHRFVALFAGLVTLADWLGSDTRRFPVEGPHGAARDAMRLAEAQQAAAARGFLPLPTPFGDFAAALEYPPHGFQTDAAADLGPVALIEAETGSGKTEAALWRWLELRRRGEVDGLFFALPTRSAAVQLHKRVNDMLRRVWGEDAPEAVLAVPGYLRSGDATGQALPGYAVRWDRGEPGEEDARWAAERANRFLAARVAVGTIDQALLGTLPVKHALFRAGVLSRSLLVVDEVHASDAYMIGLLERLLDHHVAVGGRALLLSATLGAAARARLLKTPAPSLEAATGLPYPALSGRGHDLRPAAGAARAGKRVRIEIAGIIDDADAVAARAVAAARNGAKVLVVRNSVAGAIAVAQAVAARAPDLAFAVNGVATLHHGRFAPDDRKLLDAAVEEAFGKERAPGGQVLVGTQTLEQSLDIDADLLLTDLAPMDVLLQRIGRLHRHGRDDRGAFADARVVVLRPAERDLRPLLDRTRGRHGLGPVYRDFRQLEATLRLLEETPDLVIPRDNRRLVEGATHDEALAVVTRDWGTAGQNHTASRSSAVASDRNTAEVVALDLSKRFTELRWNPGGEEAMTRLGARDVLVDLDPPLRGPFGLPVDRIAIPGWMRIAPGAEVERIDDRRFRIDGRRFAYGPWGLQAGS